MSDIVGNHPTPVINGPNLTHDMARLTTDDAIAVLKKRFYERTDEDVAGLVAFLSGEPGVFRHFPPEVIASYVPRMEHARWEGAGSPIVCQGDTNTTHAFVLLRGHCHVYRRYPESESTSELGAGSVNANGASENLGELCDTDVEVGDVFGEVASMANLRAEEAAPGRRAPPRLSRRNATVVISPGTSAVDLLALDGPTLQAMASAVPSVLFQPKILRRLLSIPPAQRTAADIADIVDHSRWLNPFRGLPEPLLTSIAAHVEALHVPWNGILGNCRDPGAGEGNRFGGWNQGVWTPGEEMVVVISGQLVVHDDTPLSHFPADELDARFLSPMAGGEVGDNTFRSDSQRAVTFRDSWIDPVIGNLMLSGIPVDRKLKSETGHKIKFSTMAKVVKSMVKYTGRKSGDGNLSPKVSPRVSQPKASPYRLSYIRANACSYPAVDSPVNLPISGRDFSPQIRQPNFETPSDTPLPRKGPSLKLLVSKTSNMGPMATLLDELKDASTRAESEQSVFQPLDDNYENSASGDKSDDDETMAKKYGRAVKTLRPGDAYGESDLVAAITGEHVGSRGGGAITLRASRRRAAAADKHSSVDLDSVSMALPGKGTDKGEPLGPEGVDVMVISKRTYDEAVHRLQCDVLEEMKDFLRRVGGSRDGGVGTEAGSGYGPLGTAADSELSNIAFLTRLVIAEKGSVLVQEGSVADGIYFVKRGDLKVTRRRDGDPDAEPPVMIPVSSLDNPSRPGSPSSFARGGKPGGRLSPGPHSPRPGSPGSLDDESLTESVKKPIYISAAAEKQLSQHRDVAVIGSGDFFGSETVPDVSNKGGGSPVLGLVPASCTVSVCSSGGAELLLLSWRDLHRLSKETHGTIRVHVAQRNHHWNSRAVSLEARASPEEIVVAAAAATAAAADNAKAEAEDKAEELAAEPAKNVIKNELRHVATAVFSSEGKSRPGSAMGRGPGTVVPFGVDGLGSYHRVGGTAAPPFSQPPLPTPCLSKAAQVGSTAQYSSEQRSAAAVAANLAVGASPRRSDQPGPSVGATAIGTHVAPGKPSSLFAARPVLETEFHAQMTMALNTLVTNSWGSSRAILSQATATGRESTEGTEGVPMGDDTNGGSQTRVSSSVAQVSSMTKGVVSEETTAVNPTAGSVPQTSFGDSVTTGKASEVNRRSHIVDGSGDSQVPLVIPSSPSGYGKASPRRFVSATGDQYQLVKLTSNDYQSPAAETGLSTKGTSQIRVGGKDRPPPRITSASKRSPPSMTQRGQPSRPPPAPMEIITQWSPGTGWSPKKRGVESRAATGGFTPYGTTLGRTRPSTAGLQSSTFIGTTNSLPRKHDAPRSVVGRRRPATAQPATRSARPVSGGPRRRLPISTPLPAPSSPPRPIAPTRAQIGSGLVGHQGQSVGGGWYYPVVPSGATAEVAPPKLPMSTGQQELVLRQELKSLNVTGAAGDARVANAGAEQGSPDSGSPNSGALKSLSNPGVHAWSITSPWDQAAGVGSLYEDALVQPGRSSPVRPKSLRKTRLVGATSMAGLPTEMIEEKEGGLHQASHM